MSAPLQKKRILVTRPAHQAEKLAAPLRSLGAEVVLLPMLEIMPPSDPVPLQQAIQKFEGYQWIVFTSSNAVRAITDQLATRGKSLENFPELRIAAVGDETAHTLRSFGGTTEILPETFTAASLAASLMSQVSGQRVLLPQQPGANPSIADPLTAAGAIVDRVEAYRTAMPADAPAALKAIFADPKHSPNVLTFTSAQTARNFFSLVNECGVTLPADMVIASIGPSTTAALTALRFPPQIAATQSSAQSLADALAAYFAAG